MRLLQLIENTLFFYGWITDEGRYLEGDHEQVLKNHFHDQIIQDHNVTDPMYADSGDIMMYGYGNGWVRVYTSARELGFQFDIHISKAVIKAMIEMIEQSDRQIMLEYSMGRGHDYKKFNDPKQAVRWLKNFSRGKITEAEIPVSDYGYWITSRGKFLPVEYEGHWYVAQEQGGFRQGNPTFLAYKAGWIRTIHSPREFNAGMSANHVTKAALFGLIRLIKETDVRRYVVDFFGGYPARLVSHDRVEIIREIYALMKRPPDQVMVAEAILLENRVDFLKQTYAKKLWDRAKEVDPGLFSHYLYSPNTDVHLFDYFLHSDPTRKKIYLQWLIKLYLTGGMRGEDLGKAYDYLERFEQLKPHLPVEQRNPMKWKTLARFFTDVIAPHAKLETDSERAKRRQEEMETKKEIRVVYEGPEGRIFVPESEKASCLLGRGTQWCTAGKNNNMFQHYHERGPLYVVLTPDGKKAQFHFQTNQFMDENDNAIPEWPEKIKAYHVDGSGEFEFIDSRAKTTLSQDYKWVAKSNEMSDMGEAFGCLWMFDNPSEKTQYEAVGKNWRNLIRLKNPSERVLHRAIDANDTSVRLILEWDPKMMTPALATWAAKRWPGSVQYMKEFPELLTPEVQKLVADGNPLSVQYIPKEIQDQQAMDIAVKKDHRSIAYVAPDKQTPELQMIAVTRSPQTIQTIWHPTLEVMMYVAHYKPDYLLQASRYWPGGLKIPQQIQLIMVNTYPGLIHRMEDPSPEVIEFYADYLRKHPDDKTWLGGDYKPRPKRTPTVPTHPSWSEMR